MNRFLNPGAGTRIAVGMVCAASAIFLDQLTKWLVLTRWPEASEHLVPVLSWLDLQLTWNKGASFSMANNLGAYATVLFVSLAMAVSIGLILWMAKGARPLILCALGLIVGGALGNGLDRLRFGAVEDFIYVHIGSFDWWPRFNIADSAICIGAGLMIFDSLFDRPVSHKNTP